MIYENTISLETTDIYTRKKIFVTYFEKLIHYKFDTNLFSDIRNKLRILQIVKIKDQLYLYPHVPRHLFITNFYVHYWLDKKLSDILDIDNHHYFSFFKLKGLNSKLELFNNIAIKINISEKDLIKRLKIHDDFGENGISALPTIETYEKDNLIPIKKMRYYYSELTMIEELKIRIKDKENISKILADYKIISERRGILDSEKYYHNNKLIFAFCCNYLVHY